MTVIYKEYENNYQPFFFVQVQIRLYDITRSIDTYTSVIDRQPYSIVRHMGIGKENKIFFSS
jgi:hypothetical protein